jgi:hypothetical protein
MKRDAELIIAPQQTYIGLYDGYLNDNLNSFSVKLRSTETWIYTNADSTDAHPLHFHLSSGFASPQSNYNSPGLLNRKREYNPLTYSRDIYQIGPQESIAFDITWPHYSSNDTTKSPNIRCIGGVIHCHFLVHNDANSMIIQYFVDPDTSMYNKDIKMCENENKDISCENENKDISCENENKDISCENKQKSTKESKSYSHLNCCGS